MNIVALVMTDGRLGCLNRTIRAFDQMVTGPVTRRIIHDDTGDRDVWARIENAHPGWELVGTPGRSGFGGAIQSAWRHLADHTTETHVWHLEDDFETTTPVDLAAMCRVLDTHPYLVQLALRRQPCNPAEAAAGGIVEQWPSEYVERSGPDGTWLEHRLFFTTNPSLYRRSLLRVGWPDGPASEAAFGERLRTGGIPHAHVTGVKARFGYWGPRSSPPMVHHIGDVRAGTGY